MLVLTQSDEVNAHLREMDHFHIAMVPTMGALHDGHLKLVKQAKSMGYSVLVSIFVNPRQFNNPEDLEKYPKTLDQDLELLASVNTDWVFVPNYEEIYSKNFEDITLNLNGLDRVFEGAFRPGHFDGVIQVLYRFFTIVNPQAVFFGQKDLQQCMVVKCLIDHYFPNLKFFQVETERNDLGLALSSRNQRLSTKGLESATAIFKAMATVKDNRNNYLKAMELATSILHNEGIEIEYFNWIELPSMRVLDENSSASNSHQAIVFAGYLEGVRLIDNLVF